MKNTLHVFRAGMAGCLVASLLAACNDGRGTNGFKSWKSTPEQRAEWLAKNQPPADSNAQGNPPASGGQQTGPGGTIDPGTVADGTGTQGGAQGGAAPAPAGEGEAAPAPAPAPATELLQDFANEEARSQVLNELEQPVSEDPAQQRVVNVADLIVANDAALNGSTDSVAAGLIKGISMFVEGDRSQRTLSLDAVVVIGADVRTLHVAQAPLKVTSSGQTTNLAISLKTVDTLQAVEVGNKVYVLGNCKDTTCNDIQVRIEFNLDNGSKAVAAFLIQLTGEGYAVTHSNIGEPQKFDVAYAAAGGQAAPAAAPATSTDEAAAGEAAGATTTTAATEATTAGTTTEDAADGESTDQAADAAPAPTVDIAGIEGIVTGENSIVVEQADGPGVGVLDPNADAITESGETAATGAAATTDTRADAIQENRKAREEAAAEALRRRAEAQRRAGAYPGAGAKTAGR